MLNTNILETDFKLSQIIIERLLKKEQSKVTSGLRIPS